MMTMIVSSNFTMTLLLSQEICHFRKLSLLEVKIQYHSDPERKCFKIFQKGKELNIIFKTGSVSFLKKHIFSKSDGGMLLML